MAVIYRTDGPWGPGLHEDLTPEQADGNFWQLVQDITTKAVQGVGISNMVVTGNQLTVVLTDHTLLGPYALPVANITFKGEWLPDTSYNTNDILTHGGSTYIVRLNHTSEITFDPGANDGHGNDFYGLLLENPALAIPAGGPVGAILRKATTADYTTLWGSLALEELNDVSILPSPPPDSGSVLTWTGSSWVAQAVSLTLEELSDVFVPAPVYKDVLTWNGSVWISEAASLSGTTVTLTSLKTGQLLIYNGSAFVNTSKVDLPLTTRTVSGATTINRTADGEMQKLILSGDVTLSITGSSPIGQLSRLVLQIDNSASHSVSWPAATKWPGGTVPTVSSGGVDIFVFTTFDGGSSYLGNVVGQNYS